jgi:hypothetical protein
MTEAKTELISQDDADVQKAVRSVREKVFGTRVRW